MSKDKNPQLSLAFDYVQYTGENIFLTGKAGTGKTTFLKKLKEQSPKRMVVVAPTGVAAINAGGVTIHSFFQMPFGPLIPEQYLNSETTNNNPARIKKFSKEKRNIIKSLDLLVIDEISMVRADLLDGIDEVLRRFKNRDLPFGGVQVLMIGDLQQLAPVIKEEEWQLLKSYYPGLFFFNSKALQATNFITIELKHIYRQSNQDFIAILNKIRENDLDEDVFEALNKRYIEDFNPNDNEGYIRLTTHNAKAQKINNEKLDAIKNKSHVFKAAIEKDFPEYSFPTNQELVLKEGAQVMFIKNDASPDKLYYNGKIGYITDIDDDIINVKCPGEDEIAVNQVEWENIKYEIDQETKAIKESVAGKFTQYPLKLAWAITIHKSQGLTFEKAIIDAESAFAHGQVYVALSRCKSLEGLVLSSKIGQHAVRSDGSVKQFVNYYENNQPDQEKLVQSRVKFQQNLLFDLVDVSLLMKQIYILRKRVRENERILAPGALDHAEKIVAVSKNEVFNISEKFKGQISRMIMENPDVESNNELQERIKKSSNYFTEKIEEYIISSLNDFSVQTDNSSIEKDINQVVRNGLDEAHRKRACFEVVSDGFNLKTYLDDRAEAILKIESGKPKKEKKKKEDFEIPETIKYPELFERLRLYRTEKAHEEDAKAYMIFHQKSLHHMVEMLPTEKAQLKKVHGFGKRKIEKYGDEIVEVIRDFMEEEGLE